MFSHTMPQPFRVDISDSDISDLQERLAKTRLPDDFANADWRYGVERGWLEAMMLYWAKEFDWRAQEARINTLPQWRVEIDGIPIHYAHIRGKGRNPTPIILTHGWPWTFWDWNGLVGPLTDPEAHGGSEQDAFDVVIPSLPGFGFSQPLHRTGVNDNAVADLWATLMQSVLGYTRYAAAGGDFGSFVTKALAERHAASLCGVHMTLPVVPGVDLRSINETEFASDERWMIERNRESAALIRSHIMIHSSNPQTLAYALNDSPAGLAAWMWERRRAWSDCGGDILSVFDRDFLCTTASIYWFSKTISTSMRFYWERARTLPVLPLGSQPPIEVPTGFGVGPKELLLLPKSLAEKHTNLQRWTILPKGGHFLPAEQPALLVEEYRAFFRPLRLKEGLRQAVGCSSARI